jgi:hypothetical protein
MTFQYDVLSLEEEVRSKNYTVESVFGKPSSSNADRSAMNGRQPERNRQNMSSVEANARKAWRPKGEGDFTVEVKKSRSIPRPSRDPSF